MTDVTVGYKLPVILAANASLAATYRYAPIAVSGTEDGHSYRGVWETHYLGGRLTYPITSTLHAMATTELGYVRVGLEELDGLDADHKHERSGAALAVGGGADWAISDKFASAGGPRVFVGYGSVTTVQIGGAFSFLF